MAVVLERIEDTERQNEGNIILNHIRDLGSTYFPGHDPTSKNLGALSSSRAKLGKGLATLVTPKSNLVDISTFQGPTVTNLSKGAISKTFKVTTLDNSIGCFEKQLNNLHYGESSNQINDQGNTNIKKDENNEEFRQNQSEIGKKEQKLKEMQANIDKKLESFEQNEDNSEDELEALIEMQKAI
jgi:hypothetical protein